MKSSAIQNAKKIAGIDRRKMASLGLLSAGRAVRYIHTFCVYAVNCAEQPSCTGGNLLKMKYPFAAPCAIVSEYSHFEVGIATATMPFGLSSGASFPTVVGANKSQNAKSVCVGLTCALTERFGSRIL